MSKVVRKTIAMLLCSSTVFSVTAAVGCGGGTGSNGGQEGTFNVYALHKGYGVDWVKALLDEFQKQDWVKEKYPNLKVATPETNDTDAYTENQMSLGSASKFDLLFSSYTQQYNGSPNVLDITDSVYNSTVPGESGKVIDKMVEGFAEANSFLDANGDTRYSTYSYVNAMYGILYNETVLNQLGYEVPVTTGELIDIMADVKSKNGSDANYPYTYSIINRANGYSYQMYSTWWAQYEGLEEYTNFYNGISDGSRSKDVLKQQGRLEALKVMEEMFKFANGYLVPNAPTLDYLNAQLGLMQGRGLFHFNGDYFTTEMEVYKPQTRGDVIKFMKNPIISSIVDRLTSIKTAAAAMEKTNDEMLAILVRDIDNNVTVCNYVDKGVTQADYDKLIEARGMVNSATTQAGMIPSWSKNKDVAIDFLRFMSTDVAYKAVLKATGGLALPFEYNAKEEAADIYANLEPAQKVKLDIYNNTVIPAVIVQEAGAFALGRAGLGPLKSIEYNGKVHFESVFGLETGFSTAQQVFDADLAYWTDDRWDNVLMGAGLK